MASKSEFAPAVADFAAKSLGVSTSKLMKMADADVAAALALLKIGPPIARHRVGGYYGPDGGAISTLLLTEDVLVVAPIKWDEYAVIEEIGVDVTTAGTEGDLYTVLYGDRGDGYPGTAIHVSAAKTVTAAFKSTTGLDIELPPGLYWGGVVCNQVTTTVATVRSVTGNSRFVAESAGANDVAQMGYSQAAVTGAPPTNFTDTLTCVGAAPRLLLKVKSV